MFQNLRYSVARSGRQFHSLSITYKDPAVIDPIKRLKKKLMEKKQLEGITCTQKEPVNKTLKNHVAKTKQLKKLTIEASELLDRFKSDFQILPTTDYEKNSTNYFFNNCKIKLEWTVDRFQDIPNEKYNAMIKEEKLQLERDLEDLSFTPTSGFEFVENSGKQNELKKNHLPEELNQIRQENLQLEMQIKKMSAEKFHKRKFRVAPELLKGLPEIALIGKTNVGKSSLLNSICNSINKTKLIEYAYSSKTAGFTTTINCFNVANKFRIIDTPGYGIKSTRKQGKEIVKYLINRKELKKIYVLINSMHGFIENDYQLIGSILSANGLPYCIIFTKIDRLNQNGVKRLSNSIKEFEDFLKESNISIWPDYYFTSFKTENKKRPGITELRFDFLQSCGLPTNLTLKKNMRKE